MTGWNKANSLWLARALGICAVLALSFAFAGRAAAADDYKPWVAPEDARKVKNPAPATPENLAAGEKVYHDNCVLCHGEKGAGDGPGSESPQRETGELYRRKIDECGNRWLAFLEDKRGQGPDATLERQS